MLKNYVLAFFLLSLLYQNRRVVNGAPYQTEDAIIIIPFQPSTQQISKIESFMIDGETAVKQLSSRVSAEKILRTLSNIPEFSILVEGLDAITVGDVYKTIFPKGILHSISEQYLRSPKLEDSNVVIMTPDNLEEVKQSTATLPINEDTFYGNENDIEYDVVDEDEPEMIVEDLKEEPITDDYVYDQPIEDRFTGDREYVAKDDEENKIEDNRGSKTLKDSLTTVVTEEEKRNKELTKYGARFRHWITELLTG